MNSSDLHERAMELFDRVCDLPRAERDAVLDEACAGDSTLRAQVEALLRADQTCDGMLDEGGSQQRMGMLAASLAEELAEEGGMPERIGGYRIIRKVGEGGMGIIYEAEQESPRRRVALKILRPGMVSRDMLKRFQHEAHVLGQLQHPGIAHIHEAGVATLPQGRQPFFVMEFIDGESLDRYANEHRLPVRQRLELMARVCDAIQHAHQKGIIHRDLKPSNVLVIREDGTSGGTSTGVERHSGMALDSIGQPKVLDFGIARVTDADIQTVTVQTEVGRLVGTLAYMSPEQIIGSSEDLDTRCDVYALGVMLYELLAGQRPHDLTGLPVTEAARLIREREPVGVATINKALRGDVETIVAKAMEKDRERRYGSAAELATDIRRHLNNIPIEARPISTFYQLNKFAHRNKGLVVGLAGTLAMLIVALLGTTYGLIKAEHRRIEAEAARRTAEERKEQIQHVADFQSSILNGLDPMMLGKKIVAGMRNEVESSLKELNLPDDRVAEELADFDHVTQVANPTNVALDTLDQGILAIASESIATSFDKQPIVQAKLYQSVGRTYASLGRSAEGAKPLRQAVELFRTNLGADAPETLQAMSDLSDALSSIDPQESLAVLKETLAGAQRVYGPKDEFSLSLQCDVGRLTEDVGQWDEAESILEDALQTSLEVLGEDSETTANVLVYLASVAKRREDLGKAEAYMRRSLAISERIDPDGESVVRAHNNLGSIMSNSGRFDEAEQQLRQAYESLRKRQGDDHPNTLIILNNIGGLLMAQHRLAEAQSTYEHMLDVQLRTLGPSHPDTLRTRQNLAGIAYMSGRPAESVEQLQTVLKGRRDLFGEASPDTLRTLNSMCGIMMELGRCAEAEALLEGAMAVADGKLPAGNIIVNFVRQSLIASKQCQDKWAESEALSRQMLDIRRSEPDADPLSTALALRLLGSALVFQDKCEEAEPLLRECLDLCANLDEKDWSKMRTRGLLGMALAGQNRNDEAEPLLLSAYESLRGAAPDTRKLRQDWWIDQTRRHIVRLYEQWNKPGEAARFADAAPG